MLSSNSHRVFITASIYRSTRDRSPPSIGDGGTCTNVCRVRISVLFFGRKANRSRTMIYLYTPSVRNVYSLLCEIIVHASRSILTPCRMVFFLPFDHGVFCTCTREHDFSALAERLKFFWNAIGFFFFFPRNRAWSPRVERERNAKSVYGKTHKVIIFFEHSCLILVSENISNDCVWFCQSILLNRRLRVKRA